MEPKFQTSFIPKKPISAAPKSKSGSSVGIFFLLGLILFLTAISAAGGLFLYQQYLNQSIERKSANLERARGAFEPTLIREMHRLDVRMKSAQEILDKHMALSAFFELLEETTLKSVQFNNFNYSVDSEGKINIALSGNALSFQSVALQSDAFGNSEFIKEAIFSDLNLDHSGNIIFNFSAVLDPSLLSYSDSMGFIE